MARNNKCVILALIDIGVTSSSLNVVSVHAHGGFDECMICIVFKSKKLCHSRKCSALGIYHHGEVTNWVARVEFYSSHSHLFPSNSKAFLMTHVHVSIFLNEIGSTVSFNQLIASHWISNLQN